MPAVNFYAQQIAESDEYAVIRETFDVTRPAPHLIGNAEEYPGKTFLKPIAEELATTLNEEALQLKNHVALFWQDEEPEAVAA